MNRSRIVIAALALAAVPVVAAPAASSPSTDWAHGLAIQPDGKIVAVGMSRRKSVGADAFALARYTVRGRLDSAFGRGGKVLMPFPSRRAARAVAVLPGGKIVAAGELWTLVRYTRTGKVDPGFGHGGTLTTDFGGPTNSVLTVIRALAVQRDGKIVAAGLAWLSPGAYFALSRYTRGGKLDPTFGRGGKVLTRFHGDSAVAVALQPDGKIVVSGSVRIVRYTSRGALDSGFGNGGVVRVGIRIGSIALQGDGEIVAAGSSSVRRAGAVTGTDSDFALVRYDRDGRLDASFGDGGRAMINFGADPTGNSGGSSDVASAVAVQADGKIVAAGTTDVRGTFCGGRHLSGIASRENLSICPDIALARFDADGTLDAAFGDGGKVLTPSVCCRAGARESAATAEAMAIQRDGKIVVGGLGPGYDFGVLRYTTRGRLDGSFGDGGRVSTDFGSG
jgi:uncharacterized delta-60 repeat protein